MDENEDEIMKGLSDFACEKEEFVGVMDDKGTVLVEADTYKRIKR